MKYLQGNFKRGKMKGKHSFNFLTKEILRKDFLNCDEGNRESVSPRMALLDGASTGHSWKRKKGRRSLFGFLISDRKSDFSD